MIPENTSTAKVWVENNKLITLISATEKKLDLSEESYTEISSNAFKNVLVVEQIFIPEKLREIKESAFEKCGDLEIVTFVGTDEKGERPSASELRIQSNAFADCRNLDSVHIKCNKLTLEKDAFAGCNKLRVVFLECNDLDFRTGAFQNSPNLTIFGNTKCKAYLEKYCKSNNLNFEEAN